MPFALRALCLILVALAAASAAEREDVGTALEELVGLGLSPDPSSDGLQLPPGVELTDGLTETEAVALALWNNAALRATLSDLGLAQADLRQAGLFVNPSYQTLIGVGSKPFEFLLTAPIEALWQRPKRVAAAKLTLEGVASRLVQNGLDLVRDTRLAYADYRGFSDQERRASEVADLAGEIADLDAKRLKAGDIGELDLQLSRLDALTAGDAARQAAEEQRVAWARLAFLAGLPADHTPVEAMDDGETPPTKPGTEELLEIASQSRPDLRAAELEVEAAGQRLGWQRTTTFTRIAPMLSTKGIGTTGIKTGPGLTGDIPLFDRGQGRISRAEAELEQAVLRLAALREQAAAETAAAVARLAQAEAALERLRAQLIPAAEGAIALSERAYEAGDIAYLDVQRARRPLLDLQLREAAASAAVQRARAELERAIGRNL
ncbi:MAG: TolC family protein [Bryobacterales bacterium]